MTCGLRFTPWEDHFDASQIAVGVGVFSLVIAIVHAARAR